MLYCIKSTKGRSLYAGAERKKGMTVKLILAPTVTELMGFLAGVPEGTNEKNLIFCEDRLTLEAERAIASRKKVTFATGVTTFARFLSGYGGKKALSKQGSVLAVGGIAAKNADRLRCFGKNPAGAALSLYETIAQLRAALVTPQMLDAAAAETEGMLSDKLKDISLVYREYLDFLSRGYLDESGVLELLPAAMEQSGKIAGTNVYFAGFSSFTKQAAEGIAAAVRSAKSVTGIFIGGREEFYTLEAADAFERYVRAAGAECVRETLPSSLPPAAEKFRESLFDAERLSRPPLQTGAVHVYEAADADDELTFIAAMIKSEIADRGMRYRDIALLLSDVNEYSVPLSKVFSEYKIPYYADVKRSAARHPLCRFLVSWLKVISESFAPEETDAFIGNEFFGEPRASRDLYRNYLVRYGNYRGGVRRKVVESAGRDTLLVYSLREKFLSAFSEAPERAEGARYCALLRRLLENFGAEKTQADLAEKLKKEGFAEESEFMSRGLECCLRVLDEAEALASPAPVRAEEFAALLLQGFESMSISLIPQTVDAVFVGDITDSKKPAAKVLFAVRLTSDLPRTGQDTALVSDRDIDRLRSLSVEIQPKIREVNARARESAAVSLCGFTERLYLSYPLSSAGKECRRSEVIDTALTAFCAENGRGLGILSRGALERSERYNAAAFTRYLACVAGEKVPALREILTRADNYRRGKSDFSAHSGLYAALKESGEEVDSLLFSEQKDGRFIPSAAEVVFKGKNTVSPTLAEGYFRCPYANFASRGLNLEERREGSVQPADTGDFMHDVLKDLALNIDLIDDERACAEFLAEKARALAEKPPYCYLKDTAQGGYSASALVREAVLVGLNVCEQLKNSDFTVFGAEQTFGYPDSPFANVYLSSGEKPFRLAGKIDRVDRCGEYTRVVDYKTGRFEVSAESYYTGRKLQLELYLHAASSGGKPAGAYYFPARVSYSAEGKDNPFRMQGFTVGDDRVVAMSERGIEKGKKSRYIDAYFGKKSKKLLEEEDFGAFIAYSALAARRFVSETQRGCIAASPYADSCSYCPYGGMCGFDGKSFREEKQVDMAEIADIVKRRRGL